MSLTKPEITVLMSCYNGELWVRDAIVSVLSQSHKDFEFIIIDDGSSDGTLEVINHFAKKDPRIIVIAKDNSGLSNSLNIGISMASGKWIARIDQDDFCEPTRLELQLEYVKQHPNVVLLGTDFLEINEHGKVIKSHTYPRSHRALMNNLTRCKRFFPHSSVFYRRDIVCLAGCYRSRTRHSEDHDLWLRISEHGELACLNKPLIRFRTHAGQATLDEGGHRAMIHSRAVKVSFFLRKFGYIDPIEMDTGNWDAFICWLENRFNQEGVFQRREVWSAARETYLGSRNRLLGSLVFIAQLFSYKDVFLLLKEKIFGSNLPKRIANEWISNGCTTQDSLLTKQGLNHK